MPQNYRFSPKYMNNVIVHSTPLPFLQGPARALFPEGATLQHIVTSTLPDGYDPATTIVSVGSERVLSKNWSVVRPKAGIPVTIIAVPMGGGGGMP